MERNQAPDPDCWDADQAALDPCYGISGMLAYRVTLRRINFQHTPVVRFRYVAINPESGDTDPSARRTGRRYGGCVYWSPDPRAWAGTTYKDDLFEPQAPLTFEQTLAENAILVMAARDFWEQAARENGITDMDAVEEAREQAVKDIDEEFLTADFQI